MTPWKEDFATMVENIYLWEITNINKDQEPYRSHEKHFICDYTNMLVKRENVKNLYLFNVFVLLEFLSPSRIFYSYGGVTMTVKGCKFFIMVISEDPWHSHLLACVWKWSCHYPFYDLGLSWLGFEHSTFRLRDESLYWESNHPQLRDINPLSPYGILCQVWLSYWLQSKSKYCIRIGITSFSFLTFGRSYRFILTVANIRYTCMGV